MNDQIVNKIQFKSFESLAGTNRAIAIGISPAYAYADGKRTDTIDGYAIDCVIPEMAFSKLRVKVAQKPTFTSQDIEDTGTGLPVCFENFSARIYSNADGVHITARAGTCTAIEKEIFIEN